MVCSRRRILFAIIARLVVFIYLSLGWSVCECACERVCARANVRHSRTIWWSLVTKIAMKTTTSFVGWSECLDGNKLEVIHFLECNEIIALSTLVRQARFSTIDCCLTANRRIHNVNKNNNKKTTKMWINEGKTIKWDICS